MTCPKTYSQKAAARLQSWYFYHHAYKLQSKRSNQYIFPPTVFESHDFSGLCCSQIYLKLKENTVHTSRCHENRCEDTEKVARTGRMGSAANECLVNWSRGTGEAVTSHLHVGLSPANVTASL